MEARSMFFPAAQHFGIVEIADVVVPRSRIADFMVRARDLSEECGIHVVACGHAGDGNVHLCLMDDGRGTAVEEVEKLLARLYEVGVSMGGTVSGEHGLGSVKKQYLSIAYDEAEISLMRRVKAAFDPNGIMNPGKVFDTASV